jgi:hypothetical protein
VSDEKGREVWWCKTHESRFLEKQPSKYALCLLSLHERNFQAIGWEDCDPVLVRVVEASRVDRLRAGGWENCPRCGGSEWGEGVDPSRVCPECAHGLVPPDGMVEAAAKAMEQLAPNAPLRFRWHVMARAALVAAARWQAPPFDTHLYPTSTNRAETLGFE